MALALAFGLVLRVQQLQIVASVMQGLFLALPFHLVAHLLVELVSMVVEECPKVVLFLLDLQH